MTVYAKRTSLIKSNKKKFYWIMFRLQKMFFLIKWIGLRHIRNSDSNKDIGDLCRQQWHSWSKNHSTCISKLPCNTMKQPSIIFLVAIEVFNGQLICNTRLDSDYSLFQLVKIYVYGQDKVARISSRVIEYHALKISL